MSNKRPRMRRPARISDLLKSVFSGTPAAARLREGRIWEVWEEAVGTGIARHATPVSFRDGVLTLAVDSAPWMQQLNFLKKDLIAKVNDGVGEALVRDLYLKAGNLHRPPAPAPEKRGRRELTAEERAWIRQQAEEVQDPELRAVFESLIRKDLEHR